jgi:hypothetical protein
MLQRPAWLAQDGRGDLQVNIVFALALGAVIGGWARSEWQRRYEAELERRR